MRFAQQESIMRLDSIMHDARDIPGAGLLEAIRGEK